MEGYLDTISYRTHKVSYSKMKISNHRFAIETGRFRKIPRMKDGVSLSLSLSLSRQCFYKMFEIVDVSCMC